MRASGLISEDAFTQEAAAREASAGEDGAAAAAAADPAVAERQYQVGEGWGDGVGKVRGTVCRGSYLVVEALVNRGDIDLAVAERQD